MKILKSVQAFAKPLSLFRKQQETVPNRYKKLNGGPTEDQQPVYTAKNLEDKTNEELASLFIEQKISSDLLSTAFANNIKKSATDDTGKQTQVANLANTIKETYDAHYKETKNNEITATSFKLHQAHSVRGLLRDVASKVHETTRLQKLTGYIKRNGFNICENMLGFGMLAGGVAGAIAGGFVGVEAGPAGATVGMVACGALGVLAGGAAAWIGYGMLRGVSCLTRKVVRNKHTDGTKAKVYAEVDAQFGETIKSLQTQQNKENEDRRALALMQAQQAIEMAPVSAAPVAPTAVPVLA